MSSSLAFQAMYLRKLCSVSTCLYSEGYSPVTMGCCSIIYMDNVACRLSRSLVSQVGSFTCSSHQTLLDQFGLKVKELQALDEDLVLAMAHLELPLGWNILGNSSGEVTAHMESLLHITVRWGLVKFSQFLLCLPGGRQALALTNEEGALPLDLALKLGHSRLVEVINNFQGSHSTDFSRAQINEHALLRFVHSSGTLTLTLNHTAEHLLETDIKLFRKYFLDRALLHKTLDRKEVRTEKWLPVPSSATGKGAEPEHLVSGRSPPEREDVKCFTNPVVQPTENEDLDFERHHSFDVLKKSKNSSTFLAASRLSNMLNGSDEVYANCMVIDQVGDLDINYINAEGLTAQSSPESMNSTLLSQNRAHTLMKETSQGIIALSENSQVAVNRGDQQPFLSPTSLCTPSLHIPFKLREFEKEQSQLKKRSSSLDALDADSEGEGNSERSRICYPPEAHGSSTTGTTSGDELDSFETNVELDFNISRTESLSISNNLQSKDSLLSGLRSRSYSCSSPKVSLGKNRLVRDCTVCDSNEDGVFLNSGRPLLQSLSLSKSVSLLHPCKQRAYSLSEPSREKRIQEEEWDKYIIPAKSESEKYKVSRTFSFLMNRMTSPRNKSKTKNKDAKDKEKLNRHQFVPGMFSGVLPCFVCDKPIQGKESFQCATCNASVHKSCRECTPPCTKKLQERYHNKIRPQATLANSSFRDIPHPSSSSLHSSSSMPVGLPAGRKEASCPGHSLSRSVPGTNLESFRRSVTSLESDADGSNWRTRSHSDELLQSMGSSPSMDSFIMEEVTDSSLWSDLLSDAQELEAESWSLAVEPAFCSKQEKDVIKRQDVIFELMQTEMHHIQTLLIMSEIFRKGMKEELQLDHSTVDKIFPCLDELLEIHRHFFYSMKERRQESCEGNDRNFVINRIGDILVQQFSEENANTMKRIYGEFCSHHKEAVSLFKELQQNKKFQNFIKVRNSNLLARRRGIPECILLVTQRITKYPVLVERILQYSKEGTEEHKDLCKAICLIKDVIAAVDLKVSEYEKKQKWLEILNKIENKTYTKLKNGHVFRKQTLISKERTLLYDGLVYWKTATGRFKDILALLLSDVLLFLQEKDQKYIFAAVDQKPSVISLQKLIAREVANEERGMFLISASSAGPEMYEIHTNSKEERNNWMRRIQEAVESCPEEEGGRTSESDEDKKKTEARVARIQQCQELLSNQDQQICTYLEEKLHIYAELGEMGGLEDVHLEPHLLIKHDPGEAPQAASLLAAALKEAESLQVAVMATQTGESNHSSEENCGELDWTDTLQPSEELTPSAASQVTEGEGRRKSCDLESYIHGVVNNMASPDAGEKAALTIQDSHIELHKLILQERMPHGLSLRGGLLQEQEKSHHLEKQREELANIHKLQHQFQQEQQRWYRKCDQRQREQEAKEKWLQEREKECQSQEELLSQSRGELDHQLQEYQQNLERLREGQRMVEREREKVRIQQSLLHHWKHSRQSSLPAAFSPGDSEVTGLNRSDSLCHKNSFFVNEALVHMSLNTVNKSNSTGVHQDIVYPLNISNSDLPRTSESQTDLKMDISYHSDVTHELWRATDPGHQVPSLLCSNKDCCNNDLEENQSQCSKTYNSNPGSGQPWQGPEAKSNLSSASLCDGDNGDGVEENIVYL
ncbi:rho guanine nucleotide exchange factor 28 isoform X3 [Phascolarctos cinereus]|uniref:Rho guanine nucleotide exchange factor 28 n=1 Tax=Phascolarctos cinereus TaxID=38626 RepID=A0A6P5L7Z6_PHACI|nr:rho guanine nucleotide exchange factor 28 isoform X2 [Phascolarctos cinereus]